MKLRIRIISYWMISQCHDWMITHGGHVHGETKYAAYECALSR